MSDVVCLSCLARSEYVDLLRPLYGQLHEHQVDVAPMFGGLLPARTVDAAWTRRRTSYVDWLNRPSGFAILARFEADDATLVGYVVGSVETGYSGWSSEGDVIGVIHDLVVDVGIRGSGIGSTLLDAVEAEFRARNVATYRLNVVGENRDALRLYERRGMTTVTRVLMGRVPEAGSPPPPAPGS
jgi:ribosomal protein S18 acetylase RimI-like enzyme